MSGPICPVCERVFKTRIRVAVVGTGGDVHERDDVCLRPSSGHWNIYLHDDGLRADGSGTPQARKEGYWSSFDDDREDQLREAETYIQNTPDAEVVDVLAELGLDLDLRDEVAEIIDDVHGDEDVKETKVGHTKADECDVYGGRAIGGQIRHLANTEPRVRGWLGNPFVVESNATDDHRVQDDVVIVDDRHEAIARYAELLLDHVEKRPDLRRALYEDVRGKVVGGWCRSLDEDEPACHLDVVADVADRIERVDGGDQA